MAYSSFQCSSHTPLSHKRQKIFALTKKNKSESIILDSCHNKGNARSFPTKRLATKAYELDQTTTLTNLKNIDENDNYEMMDFVPSKGTKLAINEEGIGITRFLEGKRLFVTGATGFLGKVLIEKILRTNPNVEKIYLLVRAVSKDAAMDRVKREILDTELFSSLQRAHGNNYQGFMLKKLVPIAGNVCAPGIGIEAEMAQKISEEVDVIVNLAANTTFDERYDVALDMNTIGPWRLMSFAKRFKRLKLFLHVSTAYVNGTRQGKVLEKPFCIGDTIARERVNSSASSEDSQNKPLLDIETEIKLAFTSQSKATSHTSLIQEMKQLGLARAKMHGWQDTYSFTKAMGEMVINSTRGDIPLVTIRPSVVESTFKEPFPGWIEGNRMIDPIILHYGKGKLNGFLMDVNGVFDIVPADMVVNTIVAAMAKHGQCADPGLHTYHIASSVENPLGIKDMTEHFYEHFNASPWIDNKGKPVIIQPMKLFDNKEELSNYIWEEAIQRGGSIFKRNSHEKPAQIWDKILIKSLDHVQHLANVYEPYTLLYRGRFDNTNTQNLMEEMSKEELMSFNFDVGCIDWNDYLRNVHIPGLRKHVMKGRGDHANSPLDSSLVRPGVVI